MLNALTRSRGLLRNCEKIADYSFAALLITWPPRSLCVQGLVRRAEGGGGAGQHQRAGAPVLQGDGGLLLGLLELQTPLPGAYNISKIYDI